GSRCFPTPRPPPSTLFPYTTLFRSLLWPPRLGGRWARVSWLLAVAVVPAGNLTLHAHRPGEVITAALLVTAVTGVLLGILAPRPVTGASPANRGTMGPP